MIKLLKQLYEKIYVALWEIRIYFAKRSKKLKNLIVFESTPDVADNTKAVFDEMIRRGLNNKYKLVWILYDNSCFNYEPYENVKYVPSWSIYGRYYDLVAKAKICCNRFFKKSNPNQIIYYLSHGTAIKTVKHYYSVPDEIDYMLTASSSVANLQSEVLNYDPKKIFALGFPRNDILTNCQRNIREILDTNCNKVIVWYPTFRQHKNQTKTNSHNALPIIHNTQFAQQVNDIANKLSTLIVIKPHFAQDISYIKELNLSNIIFIDDNFLTKKKISSYEFIGSCDALITDYSSVYYDFTLCNKPIAAVWEDIEEYKTNPGLVENYEWLMQGAEKIYNINDFIEFLQRISNNVDLLKDERQEIRDYSNYSTDGKNSERVVDFILDTSNI